jgi:tRNA/tmRNA/rRNA uracil-C5-methylase (TrmA/RlmC/RlmD family)
VNSPKIGVFQEGSHALVDIPRCVVHHPLINEVTAGVRQAIRATRTPPYSESAHAGVLRAVQVVVERASQTAQVTLVTCSEDPAPAQELLGVTAELLGARLHSLWWNGNPERTNRVLGPHWSKIRGRDTVVDVMGGAEIHFPPDAFGQANPDLAARIVEQIHAWVPEGARVLELYAGVGAIGLGLLAKGCDVIFNEIGPGSLRGLSHGLEVALAHAERQPGSDAGSSMPRPRGAHVLPGPAEEFVDRAAAVDVVIVDPPRKGLGPEVVAGLLAARPDRLIYVSCGFEAFEQEALALESAFRLEAVVAYGLFPFTDHVETLALFRARR